MRPSLKFLVFAFLYAVGITRLARWRNRQRVAILCYHGVTQRPSRTSQDPAGLHVRCSRFLAHLNYLKRHYRIISLRDYLKARQEGSPLPDYSVVLTFDDGFRNFFTTAAPLLNRKGIPATLFLITDWVREHDLGRPDPSWSPGDDETYLSWTQVRALSRNPNLELGSHTCSHSRLSRLSAEEADRELRGSYEVLASRRGTGEPLPLAYPKGDYSSPIAQRAAGLGYRCALTTDAGLNDADTDLFALKRLLIGDDDAAPIFAARVSGLIGWLRK